MHKIGRRGLVWLLAGSLSLACKVASNDDEKPRPARRAIATPRAEFPSSWPPRVDMTFPDFDVIDHTGSRRKMSSFRGRILVIEPVGMSCGACQAFSGAHRVGAFGGASVQRDLRAFDEMFPQLSGGALLTDSRIVFIQILFYGIDMGAPTAEDARKWAKHFGFDRRPNHVVVVPVADMRNDATYAMIPGFFLVERNFWVREDATRGSGRLWRHFGPKVRALLAEVR